MLADGPVSCLHVESDAEITWYKDDKQIKPKKSDKRVKVDWDMAEDLTSLSVSDATIEDAGNYLVKATTKEGTVTELVTVAVTEPATVKKAPHKAVVKITDKEEKVEPAKDIPNQETAVESETAGPKFELSPKPVTVEVGGSISLKCKVAG